MDGVDGEERGLIDVRGQGCASVLIRLASHGRTVTGPTEVIVWTDDLGAPEELPAWCRLTGNRYVGLLPGTNDKHRVTISPTRENR